MPFQDTSKPAAGEIAGAPEPPETQIAHACSAAEGMIRPYSAERCGSCNGQSFAPLTVNDLCALIADLKKERRATPSVEGWETTVSREIIKYISDAALELAFTRHDLTTTEQEETDYPDVEVAVETFKAFVEDVKADVLACLTGDETGCLDPEDVDYDNELRWLERKLAAARRVLEGEGK